jgi:large subunit ribosomal protein L24
MRARIKKNDTVMVIAGRERGKTGKVLRVIAGKDRALIEQLNLVKRHQKARGPQSASGIVEKEAPLHLSNLMIMCDKCNAPVRMGKRVLDDGHSVRVCRRCGEQLDR